MSFDPGELVDGDLYLVLEKTYVADEQRGWPPAVKFALRKSGIDDRVGEIGLRLGEPPPHLGHISYRVLPAYRGQHLAARACRLLLPLACRHGLNVLRITIREENRASRRTAELAGAEYVGMVETPAGYEDWLGPVRYKCVYHLGTE
jgi:RimJ/RimL family protein N-acetyltransferase